MLPIKKILTYWLLCLSLGLFGQSSFPINFQKFSLEDGLSHNKIKAIFQDSYGFIWIGTGNGLNRYDGYTFKKYHYHTEDTTSLSSSSITHIWEDQSRNIWVATNSEGINRFNRQTETFQRLEHLNVSGFQLNQSKKEAILSQNNSNELLHLNLNTLTTHPLLVASENSCLGNSSLNNLTQDQNGNYWFSDWRKLYHYNPVTKQLDCFQHQPTNPQSLSDFFVSEIFEDSRGNIWIGTANGLNLWNPSTRNFKQIMPQDYLPNISDATINYILSIEEDSLGNLWIGTLKGLLYYQVKEHQFTAYLPENSNLKLDAIHSLFIDDMGILWIGGATGLGVLYPNFEQFDKRMHQFFSTIEGNQLEAHKGKKIFQSTNKDYWLSHLDGLYQLKKKGNQIEQKKVLSGDFLSIYEATDGSVYAGALKQGLFKIKDNKIHLYLKSEINRISGGYMYDLLEDKAGTFWIATIGTLQRYHPSIDQVTYFNQKNIKNKEEVDLDLTLDLHLDKKGNLWLGTLSGLYFLSKEELEKPYGVPLAFKHYVNEKDNLKSLSIDNIRLIHETQDGEIWIGTENGLNHFHNGQFTRYTQQMEGCTPAAILEDDDGNLWIGTSNGLFRFNINTKIFTRFSKADGLPSNSFRFQNCLKDADGLLIFATEKGFISFRPEDIGKNNKIPPVFLTNFKLNNHTVSIGQHDSLLKKPIYLTDDLILDHSQNVLTFQFSALNYLAPTNNQYAYQLVGFDEHWQYIGNRREVTFTNLNAGDYLLKIKATNNDGVWNEKGTQLKIKILPPWYLTRWAYLLWTLLSLGILFFLYRFQLNRQLAHAETVRLQELDRAKTSLYTNITHEFRTPLTVISGMTEQLNGQQRAKQVIQRNSKRLLSLVNQLLDLSKLESGKLPLNLAQSDLIVYLNHLIKSLHSFAESKEIQLHFLPEMKRLQMDFDSEKLQSIIINLLSNAIKFTPPNGTIYLQVRELKNQVVQISVRDTGKGIAVAALPHIFNRFYQTNQKEYKQGSGIGLELTKGLVELLKGEIKVISEVGVGSTFSVFLPIKKIAPLREIGGVILTSPIPTIKEPLPSALYQKGLPTLLLVEDNEDLLQYLYYCLQSKYNLIIAKNGQEGIEKALALIPDIILSDVMMPEKNGLELCQRLKNEEDTNHIPIILLTAKADFDSKLEGLATGADAYLTKPFQEKELLLRLEKLLELRQKLRSHYTSNTFLENPSTPTNPDEVFLQKLKKCIEEEMTSPDFDIDVLRKKMALSRTALYNKTNALVGMPPGEFIRFIRLNHAKRLLKQTNLSITEIAYQSGFSSQSFFSRTFSSQEGQSPTSFRNEI